MSILESVVASGLLLGAAVITNVCYIRRHLSDYGNGKTRAAVPAAFSASIDKYLRISTVLVAIASIWINAPFLVQAHKGTVAFMIGAMLVFAAESLFVCSMNSLGPQYSPCFDSYVPLRIVECGPYRFIRHPIYLSNILLIAGISMMAGTLLLLVNAGILAACYSKAARQEETYLRATYPEYCRYQERTGMFLPTFESVSAALRLVC